VRTIVAATCSFILAMTSAAWAAPITLQAQSLLTTPGVVIVDAQNTTAVQFCDTIGWLAFKAPWLKAQISQQDRRVLLLDASAGSGDASMAVWVEGEGAPLQLVIRASGTTLANHVYFVSCARQSQPAAQNELPRPMAGSAPSAAPQGAAAPSAVGRSSPSQTRAPSAGVQSGTWDTFVSRLSARQWELLQALIVTPSAETYSAFTGSLDPDQTATWGGLAPEAHLTPPAGAAPIQPGPPTQPWPAWLSWQAHAVRSDQGLLVAYTLTNTGTTVVVVDPARLKMADTTGAVVAGQLLSRQDTSGLAGRVAPGGVESGIIKIPTAPVGSVGITWSVTEIGSGWTYVLTDTLPAPSP